jgi:hypothetical protein
MTYKPSRLAVTKLVGHMSEQHDDPQIERIQNGLEQDKWDTSYVPFNVRDGILQTFRLDSAHPFSSPTTVPTKLGRKMSGWMVVRKSMSAAGDIWETSCDDKAGTVTFAHSFAGTGYITIWFF